MIDYDLIKVSTPVQDYAVRLFDDYSRVPEDPGPV
jgi:hypothetical protein